MLACTAEWGCANVVLLQCIMFFALQVDRGNLAQAVSDNMLDDLGMDTDGQSSDAFCAHA